MKVSELEGAELDYWTAKAVGNINPRFEEEPLRGEACLIDVDTGFGEVVDTPFSPSKEWAHGGPLIEEYSVSLIKVLSPQIKGRDWVASLNGNGVKRGTGETPLQAACRAIVASVYGDGVPDE